MWIIYQGKRGGYETELSSAEYPLLPLTRGTTLDEVNIAIHLSSFCPTCF